LFQTKILKFEPEKFLSGTNENVYQMILIKNSGIDSSIANIPKKPIRKVIAPKTGTEVLENKPDTTKENLLNWHFLTNQGVEVLNNGVLRNDDDTNVKISTHSDMMDYRLTKLLNNPFRHKRTIPLFLWLDDQDAKAIYRALLENPGFIFRD